MTPPCDACRRPVSHFLSVTMHIHKCIPNYDRIEMENAAIRYESMLLSVSIIYFPSN